MDSFQYIKTLSEVQKAVKTIGKYTNEHKYIAVGFEGDHISRNGSVSILTIATKDDVFIFDILELGKDAFNHGIASILENDLTSKIVFDCREPADALYHVYSVMLAGVLDVQLLQCMDNIDEIRSRICKKQRWDRTQEVIQLRKFMPSLRSKKKKNKKFRRMKKISANLKENIWEVRPLKNDILAYCEYSVQHLFKLFDGKIPFDEKIDRLKIASASYCNSKRCLHSRYFNEYELNPFLPTNIIPEKVSVEIKIRHKVCKGCKSMFPYDEFPPKQLIDRQQKCRVCKIVNKHLRQVQKCNELTTEDRRERVPCVDNDDYDYANDDDDDDEDEDDDDDDDDDDDKNDDNDEGEHEYYYYHNGHDHHFDECDVCYMRNQLNYDEDDEIAETVEQHYFDSRKKRKSIKKLIAKHSEHRGSHHARKGRKDMEIFNRCCSEEKFDFL
ncbi:Hypothetical predicted protein [Mytilus galloprovincialis]|uniref:3'-5' exonuclease domain-containing protein n=1 Tax=Mytilus galloprovincialis TaxID=29158 RepID=A0A8B6DIY2_MYTGA|nr:Hypothetical predicted protein [Mytilus galloprovincialis]